MTLNLFRHLMPREESFTVLFCEQTKCIVAAAQELRRMINTGDSNDVHVMTIRSLELEADEVAKKVFIAANRTFNAPIDREDILALAHDLDDAVDLIEDTAKGIQRYGVREFPAQMRAMADAVVQSAEVLQEVMPLLDAITQEHKNIFSLCEKIGRIEGEADECFDAGLSHLRVQLQGGAIDTIAYIDRKELYELLEEVVDKCDDVANALQSVTAKHV
jgi:predicted phosphate transport protein (TIGR00153 family)